MTTAPAPTELVWVDCSHCIGQTTCMPDGVWVHEDGEAGCYAATPNLAWPNITEDAPPGYEAKAAAFWGNVHPSFPLLVAS